MDKKKTILIVDDEEIVRDVGRKILEEFGYKVVTAKNGEEAVGLCRDLKGQIDLVILDLGMPGMGGMECLALLRKEFPGLNIVVSSGSSDQEPRRAIESGAVAFLNKPYRMNDLLELVEKL